MAMSLRAQQLELRIVAGPELRVRELSAGAAAATALTLSAGWRRKCDAGLVCRPRPAASSSHRHRRGSRRRCGKLAATLLSWCSSAMFCLGARGAIGGAASVVGGAVVPLTAGHAGCTATTRSTPAVAL